MKLRCIKNEMQEEGWIGKKTVKVDGITVGNTYNAFHCGCNGDVMFYLFDDEREWEYYDPKLFEPAE